MTECRRLTDLEIKQITRILSVGEYGQRNSLLFSLGIQSGFRIAELLAIRLRHIISQNKIADQLAVPKKYMKKGVERPAIPLTDDAKRRISNWLETMRIAGFVLSEHFLFQSFRHGNEAITTDHGSKLIREAARSGGLTGKVSSHSMRRTFAIKCEEYYVSLQTKGEQVDPLRCVQFWLGHKSITSTEKYVRKIKRPHDEILEIFK